MKAKFRGVTYRIKQRPNKRMGRTLGRCDDPSGKRPKIIFNSKLFGSKRELEVLVHEALHACFWDLGEDAVTEAGISISKFLKKMGVKVDSR